MAALLTGAIGALSVATATAPEIAWRHGWRTHVLLSVAPASLVRFCYALSLPLGAALLVLAPYLWKARLRARRVATALLAVTAAVSLLKGLDIEAACLCVAAIALLRWGAGAFTVIQEPITLRSAVWRVPVIGALGMALIGVADWADSGRPKMDTIVHESTALMRMAPGVQHLQRHTVDLYGHVFRFEWMPLAIHLLELGTLLAIAYVLFKPLAVPARWPAPAVRGRAIELVRAHGHDTLAFFKLRPDKLYFFNARRSAFVGYRIEAGTLLLSGDPVGPVEAFAGLLLEVRRFARSRGLRLAALGASSQLIPIYEGLGLRTFYLGDEAVVDTSEFSLEGRAIRKVRQSVTRLEKAGYGCEVCTLDQIGSRTMAQLQRLLAVGRIGDAERGFSMGMDGIRGVLDQDTLFVLARDGEGALRGVLHFVPCYGRAAMSLSIMRRDPDSPNGLMEFLVVQTIEAMRERGIREVSLNFATFTKYMHSPEGLFERAVALLAHRLDAFMQIESLYRFNVKFNPRWNPRYLVYEGRAGIVRAGLAALWAEGQIPRPRVPRAMAHPGQRALKTANR